jgi:ubiquinone/menaquinone biosynthesis C-methylase UbiE
MLKVAKRNIYKQNFACLFKFIEINNQVPFSLPFETQSTYVITMNSVLHHISDTDTFLKELIEY